MKFFCIGKNYQDHVQEMGGGSAPSHPVVFMKPRTALLENNKTFYLPTFSQNIHYETEIIVKIGTAGKSISEATALSYISEMTLGFDFTARDLQAALKEKGHPWEIAKSFDYSAAVGDFIEFSYDDLLSSHFSMKLNNRIVQTGDPNSMIFSIPKIIAYLSQHFTLQRGDLIFTGTPSGVGKLEKGDLLQAYWNNQNLLTIDIK